MKLAFQWVCCTTCSLKAEPLSFWNRGTLYCSNINFHSLSKWQPIQNLSEENFSGKCSNRIEWLFFFFFLNKSAFHFAANFEIKIKNIFKRTRKWSLGAPCSETVWNKLFLHLQVYFSSVVFQNKILSTWADKFSQHPFSSSFTSLGELKLRMYRQGWEWASWLKDHRPNFTHVGSDIDGHQKNGDCNYQLTHSSSKHVDARIIQMTAWWKDALVQSAFA